MHQDHAFIPPVEHRMSFMAITFVSVILWILLDKKKALISDMRKVKESITGNFGTNGSYLQLIICSINNKI